MQMTITYGKGFMPELPMFANKGVSFIGNWMANNYGVQQEFGLGKADSAGTQVVLWAPTGTAIVNAVTPTVPHTWKNQDTISLSIQYQCVMP